MEKKKSRGAHGMRLAIMTLERHLDGALEQVAILRKRARDVGVIDQVAVAVRALRSIANSTDADARSRGLARAALAKMEVGE